jgi:hypothetical protein
MKNGLGRFTWKNKDVYIGEWKDDKRNGQGKMTYANGKVEEGKWENNKFLG